MNAIESARQAARKAQEKLYDGLCSVTEFQKVKDPETKLTSTKPVEVLADQPCRLSYSALPAADQSNTVTDIAQSIKLFIAPEVVISAGSKITVTQAGRTENYARSGQPAIYATHQEINLELYEDKA
ncbi:MAG TPA: hypothetical protein PKA10_07795 [Selenomonadales bacterium]|nr:hypothetical protein [Selenomonadales bacterium]